MRYVGSPTLSCIETRWLTGSGGDVFVDDRYSDEIGNECYDSQNVASQCSKDISMSRSTALDRFFRIDCAQISSISGLAVAMPPIREATRIEMKKMDRMLAICV